MSQKITKKLLFLTGTRADFGKIKPLIQGVHKAGDLDYALFVTGMHPLARYGSTVWEVRDSGFRNIHEFHNQYPGEPMEAILANTISGISRYVSENPPDLIVVHGDRIEALAGAIVGALRNILVAHIEGGEVSGTVDELIRHSVSKLSHIHFVSNKDAETRLLQLGEEPQRIHIIGSAEIDAILSPNLPSLGEAKAHYEIRFNEPYAILLFHPITTEIDLIYDQVQTLVEVVDESNLNFIVVYPNNDMGHENIFRAYCQLNKNSKIHIFPSIRFEYFVTFLKNALFILGNSSTGIREAPVCGTFTLNIGSRQTNRFNHESIINLPPQKELILNAITDILKRPRCASSLHFGKGNSAELFIQCLHKQDIWSQSTQKNFRDLPSL